MLERQPQVSPESKFEPGEAWCANSQLHTISTAACHLSTADRALLRVRRSVDFLVGDVRDQQVEQNDARVAHLRIPLEKKEEEGTLTEEEAARLKAIRSFDPTSH